jgi:TIR domain/Restriction endonuclease
MSEPVRVFVSHHHSPKEDAATARLVADLQAAGADVWVDYQGVASGSFVQKINEGLSGRQWLVLVMTNAALGSQWVQNEVNAALHQVALGRMRGVIPLMMTRCDDAVIPPLWAQLQRYDATNGYHTARDGLLRAMGLSLPPAKDALRPPRQEGARQMTPDDLRALSPREFEDAVALMLTSNGYGQVSRLNVSDAADLLCTALDGSCTYVWCKRYQPGNLVRQQVVMEALGAVATGGRLPIQAMIVTSSGYTARALALAQEHVDQIRLVDGQQLVEMMQRVQPK